MPILQTPPGSQKSSCVLHFCAGSCVMIEATGYDRVFSVICSKVRTKNLKGCPQLLSLSSDADWKRYHAILSINRFSRIPPLQSWEIFQKAFQPNIFVARLKQFILVLTLSSALYKHFIFQVLSRASMTFLYHRPRSNPRLWLFVPYQCLLGPISAQSSAGPVGRQQLTAEKQ